MKLNSVLHIFFLVLKSFGFENGRVGEFRWIQCPIGRIVSASPICVLDFSLDLVRLRLFLDLQYLEKPPFSGHFSPLYVCFFKKKWLVKVVCFFWWDFLFLGKLSIYSRKRVRTRRRVRKIWELHAQSWVWSDDSAPFILIRLGKFDGFWMLTIGFLCFFFVFYRKNLFLVAEKME